VTAPRTTVGQSPVRRAPVRRLVAAIALAGVVAACGGDGGDDATAQPDDTVAPPTTGSSGAGTGEPGGEEPGPAGSAGTTEPPSTTAAATPASLEDVEVRLREVAVAEQPVAVIVQPDTGELFVVERVGTVRALEDGAVAAEPLLDISADTVAEGERGLLGAAFSPEGDRLYLSYTNRDGDSRLHEWTVSDGVVDEGSRREVLAQAQPFANHNGGHILFGPDGLLWFGLGDGGASGDPEDRAQDPDALLGKILRIDPAVRGDDPYGVPGDNPFAGGGGRGEIAITGVRNPWRFSFDRTTGALWIGDVGQNEVEEVTALPEGGILGANLGWDQLEGTAAFEGEPPAGAVPPVYEYRHDEGVSITGGVVYRGDAIPGLRGAYLFGDLATAEVWALPTDGTSVGARVALGVGVDPGTLVSFAEDADGEVYVISIGGSVSRLEPA
jgi:glucose/arabinose dehydrogenase